MPRPGLFLACSFCQVGDDCGVGSVERGFRTSVSWHSSVGSRFRAGIVSFGKLRGLASTARRNNCTSTCASSGVETAVRTRKPSWDAVFHLLLGRSDVRRLSANLRLPSSSPGRRSTRFSRPPFPFRSCDGARTLLVHLPFLPERRAVVHLLSRLGGGSMGFFECCTHHICAQVRVLDVRHAGKAPIRRCVRGHRVGVGSLSLSHVWKPSRPPSTPDRYLFPKISYVHRYLSSLGSRSPIAISTADDRDGESRPSPSACVLPSIRGRGDAPCPLPVCLPLCLCVSEGSFGREGATRSDRGIEARPWRRKRALRCVREGGDGETGKERTC